MNAVNLRFAEEKDMKSVLALIQELADFEKEPDAVVVTEADLKRDAFGEQPKFQCIIAEKEKIIIGMALFYPRYSTWKGPTLHLEDLIVTHKERGTGVGNALYTAFIDYAVSQKVKRIEWVVLDWNTHAVNFYKESGASVLADWCTVQMDEVAMQQYLAKRKMRIFKFGGASVKDAPSVKNVASVLKKVGYEDVLIIVSAMGKTTNTLEAVIDTYQNKPEQLKTVIQELEAFHLDIVEDLLGENKAPLVEKVRALIQELLTFFEHNKSPNYSFIYDQAVSFGELLSTTIIVDYLVSIGLPATWLDARQCVKTDNYYRDANLDWVTTQSKIKAQVNGSKLIVSQGFIGSDSNNFTTTLGREGSDYSAAIFAYALGAESVSIWKDVPGVLNGDPRHFEDTVLLNQISYHEAIELAFYGASVIHPKTLQPLQRKEIPLYVRSFIAPEGMGTAVYKGQTLDPHVPCFIIKKDQVLLKLSSLDFSFIVEDNISDIFASLSRFQMRVELIQNSAISFSVVVNNKYDRLEELLVELRAKYKVKVTEDVSLFTVRHFDQAAKEKVRSYGEKILLEQRTRETLQVVLKG